MEGSINSEFVFESYKVDSFRYDMPLTKAALLAKKIDENRIKVRLGLRQPKGITQKNSEDTRYIVGLNAKIFLEGFFELEAGLVGVFMLKNTSELSAEKVEELVHIHFPTLLLPMLRSLMHSFISSSGFGSAFIFPLINMHKLAKESSRNTAIEYQAEADDSVV